MYVGRYLAGTYFVIGFLRSSTFMIVTDSVSILLASIYSCPSRKNFGDKTNSTAGV